MEPTKRLNIPSKVPFRSLLETEMRWDIPPSTAKRHKARQQGDTFLARSQYLPTCAQIVPCRVALEVLIWAFPVTFVAPTLCKVVCEVLIAEKQQSSGFCFLDPFGQIDFPLIKSAAIVWRLPSLFSFVVCNKFSGGKNESAAIS